MNKQKARDLVRSGITWGRVQAMFQRALDAGNFDGQKSVVNPAFTKAQVYDILSGGIQDYDPDSIVRSGDAIGVQNCLREFGQYWE